MSDEKVYSQERQIDNNFIDINNNNTRPNENPPPSSYIQQPNNYNYQENAPNNYSSPQQNYIPPQQPNNVNPIIINSQPNTQPIVYVNPSLYKTNPVASQCNSCRNSGLTRVVTEFDMANYCCYFCFGIIVWLIYQAVRDKDISCMNADHYCSYCGFKIYSYKAC
jgi:hypothetical protein